MTITRCFRIVLSSSRNFKFHIIKFFHHQIFSIQLIFDQWKHWQQIRFNESFCQRFCHFENNYQTVIIFHHVIHCPPNFVFFWHQKAVHHYMFWHLFAHSAKTVWMIKIQNFVNVQKLREFNFFNSHLCNQMVFCFYLFNMSAHFQPFQAFGLNWCWIC